MIVGIGVDIVQVKRFERWLQNPKLLERFFHPEELQTVLQKKSGACVSLASRFAAKEAFAKALGTGLRDIVLKDIMIENTPSGQPIMRLLGTALQALKKSGADKIHVSLSHETDNAIAMIVLEKS
ncbi:MAG: holo-ACP synthase [Treponema sp.]|jgi:holo-[acyl-carrier protein] synthase|nr:holo-ACP synthase [Treponema sp.]